MTKEQMQYKMLIKADLNLVNHYYNSSDKYERLIAAYHMQQAIEKTLKLKAEICGISLLWTHDIEKLINECDKNNLMIKIPSLIRKNAEKYSSWEAECRYYPQKIIRKESIKNAYDITCDWLESGNTFSKNGKR